MQAGKLNRRVTITRTVNVVDASGFASQDTVSTSTVWASVTPISQRKQLEEGKEAQGQMFEVIMRKDSIDVSNIEEYTLTDRGTILKIHSFVNINDNDRFIKILCSDV